jgi:manganese/zinc/iron transport system substrate-binding protein
LNTDTIRIATTTGMINDIVLNVGKELVSTQSLMGPGVDPHLYKASAKDVSTLSNADIIFYNGLHLEGKMTEVFENMSKRGIKTVAVAEAIDKSKLLQSPTYKGYYDPHVWFDAGLWSNAVESVTANLVAYDPENKEFYLQNSADYQAKLKTLGTFIHNKVNTLNENKRVLITAHDAFGYFGKAYNFEVIGLQGVSTDSEASTADLQNLSKLIVERQIPAIFVESSVSPKYIEAVKEAVNSKGFNVRVGGVLYSDALGNYSTPEGTYVGMFEYNVNTIVDSLNR